MYRQVFTRLRVRQRLAVYGNLRTLGPSRNSQIESKVRSFGRRHGNFDAAVPWIICSLYNLQASAVLQMPIEFRIVVKVQIDPIAAGAVEISGERGKDALEIRRATRHVVPGIPNLVSCGGIKRQR